LIEEIKAIVAEHAAVGIVVGLPRGLDGQETQQTQHSRTFTAELAKKVSLPVYMIDEAATTVVARSRTGSNENIDAHAAVIIAEDFVHFRDNKLLLFSN